MRLLPPFLLLALGCAGALAPGSEPHAFQALTIDVLEGTVGEVKDEGLSGNIYVETTGVSQAVVWTPLDVDGRAVILDVMWSTAREMVTDGSTATLERPPVETFEVNGVESTGWTWDYRGIAYATIAIVPCESSGVDVTVYTGGLKVSAAPVHAAALDSLRCAATPPAAAAPVPRSWVFKGGPEWVRGDDPTPDSSLWTNGTTVYLLHTAEGLAADEPALAAALCHAVVNATAGGLSDSYTVDPATVVDTDTPQGCQREVTGVAIDGASTMRARFNVHRCGAESSVVSMCMVQGTSSSLDACTGLFACAGG